MKIESPAFTRSDLETFLDELLAHDTNLLADRLEKASTRLEGLGPRIEAVHGGEQRSGYEDRSGYEERSGHEDWSGHEVLAHIAVLSKFYGVLVHKISSGKMTELHLLQNVNLRDVAGEQMAELDPAELLRMSLADQSRTLQLLRTVDPASLRRAARLEDGTMMSAEEVARLPLVSHLEMHIDQLEKTLKPD